MKTKNKTANGGGGKKRKVSVKVTAVSPKSLATRKSVPVSTSAIAPKVITPVKNIDTKSFTGFKFFYFSLKNGTNEAVQGVKKARSFVDEWDSIILNVRKFQSKQLWDKFKDSQKPNDLSTPPRTEKISADRLESAKKLAEKSEDNSPSNEILGSWKTTSHSTLAVVIIDFNGSSGQPIWSWKGPIVINTLTNWTEFFKVDEEFGSFLESLTHGFVRDPDSDDPNCKKITRFEPTPGRILNLDNHVVYGYVNIPVDDLASKEEETAWLTDKIAYLLNQLRELLKSPDFKEAMLHKTYKRDFVEKMFDHKKGNNFPFFLDTCRVRVQQVCHLTDHIVQNEADIVMTHLFNNRQVDGKYVFEDVVESEDEDDDKNNDEAANNEKNNGENVDNSEEDGFTDDKSCDGNVNVDEDGKQNDEHDGDADL